MKAVSAIFCLIFHVSLFKVIFPTFSLTFPDHSFFPDLPDFSRNSPRCPFSLRSSNFQVFQTVKPGAVLRQLRCEVHPTLCIQYTVYCPYGLWRPSVGGGGGCPRSKCDMRSVTSSPPPMCVHCILPIWPLETFSGGVGVQV